MLNDKMTHERCIEEEAGTPTLTVELENTARMIPWSAFVSGSYEKDRIELAFVGWSISLEGERLDELWASLQLQDVRILRALPEGDDNDCLIRTLSMVEVTDV